MQIPMVASSCFKYVHMQLFRYNMRSKNSQKANNNLEVIPCHELYKVDHLVNLVAYLTKLKSSKHQDVHLLNNLFTRHLVIVHNEPK